MVKLTCVICLLTILLLSTFALCTDFGENVEIHSRSHLDFQWKYWGWNQEFELLFGLDGASDTKLMNARVNYTEGCFHNAACPETTLLSVVLEMENIRKDLFLVNRSAIVAYFKIGDMINVDLNTLELRATNSDGDLLINSDKIRGSKFALPLMLSKFLNSNINSVLFTLIGNRLPSRFNFTLGHTVNVTYNQENHFESERKDLDLTIYGEDLVYTISDVKLSLSDYYKTLCIYNQVYRWIDVIRYDTNKKFIIGSMDMTYTFKGNSDYFGNSLESVNMGGMQMYQSNNLAGQNIDSRTFYVQYFKTFYQGRDIYVLAPVDKHGLTNVDASLDKFTKGKVSKGDFKVFNVKFTASNLITNFNYQVTSPTSSAIFSVANVMLENDICPKNGGTPIVFQADYSSSVNSKAVLTSVKGPTHFSVIVGCISDTDCEFSFKISENQALDSVNDKSDLDLVPIIVPSVVIFTLLVYIVVGIVVFFIIYKKRKERMQDNDTLNTPLFAQP